MGNRFSKKGESTWASEDVGLLSEFSLLTDSCKASKQTLPTDNFGGLLMDDNKPTPASDCSTSEKSIKIIKSSSKVKQTQGTIGKKQEWAVTLYDLDQSTAVSEEDLARLVTMLYKAAGSNIRVSHSGCKKIKLRLSLLPDDDKPTRSPGCAPNQRSSPGCTPDESKSTHPKHKTVTDGMRLPGDPQRKPQGERTSLPQNQGRRRKMKTYPLTRCKGSRTQRSLSNDDVAQLEDPVRHLYYTQLVGLQKDCTEPNKALPKQDSREPIAPSPQSNEQINDGEIRNRLQCNCKLKSKQGAIPNKSMPWWCMLKPSSSSSQKQESRYVKSKDVTLVNVENVSRHVAKLRVNENTHLHSPLSPVQPLQDSPKSIPNTHTLVEESAPINPIHATVCVLTPEYTQTHIQDSNGHEESNNRYTIEYPQTPALPQQTSMHFWHRHRHRKREQKRAMQQVALWIQSLECPIGVPTAAPLYHKHIHEHHHYHHVIHHYEVV